MPRIVCYIAASLDGFIARKDGDVSWLDPFNVLDYGYDAFYGGIGSLVMGSGTYQFVLDYGKWLYDKKAFVITKRQLPKMEGADLEFFAGELPELVEKAKAAAGGKDVWLIGGGKLLGSFINAKLLDELILFQMPLLLHDGIPLFTGVTHDTCLKLLSEKSYENGVVELRYLVC